MRDGESLNQKKPWPLSSALRPFCSAKLAVVGRYLQMPDTVESLLWDLNIPAFAVVAKKTNARIVAQEGAFFLFGMKTNSIKVSDNPGTYGEKYYSFEPIEMTDHKKLWHIADKVIIPAREKEKILKQLDIIGINEQRLFPDVEHQLKYIWSKYKTRK